MSEQRVKEQAGGQEGEILVININLTQGLVVLLTAALLVAALLGYLAWTQAEVAASGPQAPLDSARDRPLASSAGMRQYYLTKSAYIGAEADGTDGNGAGVCAAGYHFASLWEILDPSNLKYNTDLGATRDDSGQGPPAGYVGWVRTGYSRDTSLNPGMANCDAWTSRFNSDYGTYAYLPIEWTAGWQDIHVWEVSVEWYQCGHAAPVWCVED